MHKVSLLSISINTGTYKEFIKNILEAARLRKSYYACVANVHMLVEANKNKDFAKIVRGAKFITPDGKPLAWALKMLYGIKQERVAGMDLLPDLLHQAEADGIPVYFYGGEQKILNKTCSYLQKNYPGLILAGTYSPPFRLLSADEQQDIVNTINDSGARLVFVILGCPKQEKWMASMKGKINAVMVGVGGALPVMIGAQKRAPKWMQDKGMEWIYRLMQEPGRLFKRYAVTNTWFVYLMLKAYLRRKIERAGKSQVRNMAEEQSALNSIL